MELSLLAANIRTLIKWGLACLVGLFFVWLLWLVVSFSFNAIFPPPANQADQAFGRITHPFEPSSSKKLAFNLETPGGNLPDSPLFLPVYAIPNFTGRFDSLDKGNEIAASSGLDRSPTKLNEPVWKWGNASNPNQSLKLNVVTNNFNYSYDWASDPTSLDGVFKTTDDDLISQAKNFLNLFKSLKDDLKDGSTRVTYWNLKGSERIQVGSLSEANAAMVEFFRKKVSFEKESYQVVEPNSNLSQVTVLVSPNNDSIKQLLEINFTYWPVDFSNSGTYAIRSASDAYDDLQAGKALVASGNIATISKVSISKVYLAYFNPVKDTRYFQPVWVFEGSGKVGTSKESFIAYVPAVIKEFLK